MSTGAEQHLALGALKSAGSVHGALQPESVATAALLGMGASYNPRRIDPDQLLALRRSFGVASQPLDSAFVVLHGS